MNGGPRRPSKPAASSSSGVLRPVLYLVVFLAVSAWAGMIFLSMGQTQAPPAKQSDIHGQVELVPASPGQGPKVTQRPALTGKFDPQCSVQDEDKNLLDRIGLWLEAERGKPRLLCSVYTFHEKHEAVKIQYDVWGKRCDGFAAFSDQSDPSVPTIVVEPKGGESYNNMWQKVRMIWRYIHDNLMQDYDWFLMGGDDLFVIVENLRAYLLSEYELSDITAEGNALYIGRRFVTDDGITFNSGGSGYLLNRFALEKLGELLYTCHPDHTTFSEDTMVALCLSKHGVMPSDTRDSLGAERFHPFVPSHHLTYRIPDNPKADWYSRYSIELLEGFACCSRGSISFHYVSPDLMRRLGTLLYQCRSWMGALAETPAKQHTLQPAIPQR